MSAPLKVLKPKLALNKAFLKVSPLRSEIEVFKANLIKLIDQTNDVESEEFHKNLVSDFLKDTYYKQNHFINTKGRNDLVIHNGKDAKSSVGVMIEAKKPTKTPIPTNNNGLKNVITMKDLFRTLAINSLFMIRDNVFIFYVVCCLKI